MPNSMASTSRCGHSAILSAGGVLVAVVVLGLMASSSSASPRRILSDPGTSPVASAGSSAEQIHLQLTQFADEMLVYWVSLRQHSQVKYGVDQANLDLVAHSDGGWRYEYGGAASGSYTSGFMHEVVLTGLQLETSYFYQVGDSEDGFSRIYRFTSRSVEVDGPVSFFALGSQDSKGRQQSSNSGNVLQRLLEDKRSFDFGLHAGDIINANGAQGRWDDYGRWMQPLSARVPLMYAPGDEEKEDGSPFQAWLSRFRHQEGLNPFWKPFWYSFTQGPVHVAMLSSEHFTAGGEYVWDWLEMDLARADSPARRKRAPFIVVVLHRPLYNSGESALSPLMAARLEPLFERYRVSVVLHSHCHNYERTKPMFEGRMVNTGRGSDRLPYVSSLFQPKQDETHGVIYLTVGTGGRSGPRCPSRPWTVGSTLTAYGYAGFTATRRQLDFKFVDHEGRTRDSFRICSVPGCAAPPDVDGGYLPDVYRWSPPDSAPGGPEQPAEEAREGAVAPAPAPAPASTPEPAAPSAQPLEECDLPPELTAQGDDLTIAALGSGCTIEVVTSVAFKLRFDQSRLMDYEENQRAEHVTLPGSFIGSLMRDIAAFADVPQGWVDLYDAATDGRHVTLSIDTVFPAGRLMEDVKTFATGIKADPDGVFRSFPQTFFEVHKDTIQAGPPGELQELKQSLPDLPHAAWSDVFPPEATQLPAPGEGTRPAGPASRLPSSVPDVRNQEPPASPSPSPPPQSQPPSAREGQGPESEEVLHVGEAIAEDHEAWWNPPNATQFAEDREGSGQTGVYFWIFVVLTPLLVAAVALVFVAKLCCRRDGQAAQEGGKPLVEASLPDSGHYMSAVMSVGTASCSSKTGVELYLAHRHLGPLDVEDQDCRNSIQAGREAAGADELSPYNVLYQNELHPWRSTSESVDSHGAAKTPKWSDVMEGHHPEADTFS